MAQRVVRAKARIKEAGLLYVVPDSHELDGRLDAVLRVVYLVFNEGYSTNSGPRLARPDLSDEAIRLTRPKPKSWDFWGLCSCMNPDDQPG